ncbi:BLUF domain-containing protein [Gillisia limnaea]|uniref:BLUF domain protein n=1 Tax=Gillisia limnaea (strain DSM 15749 / LMG 21470 / R-8282) TaxID=865937 RepID=H2BVP6_GILLR|nr:BLUF domain-containing protein [Gillisia limnaea]EHQ04002.1 BLUF domain protein [Gillisia limnaea DSM 15749]
MRFVISYVSTAIRELHQDEVVNILEETQIRNNKHGVNGLLIYTSGNFFEVIEGEKIRITDLFKVIKEDPRHKNIILIFEKEVDKPLFKDKDANFISENTLHRQMEVENFLYYIKDLDEGTQTTVKNILKAIATNS